VTDRETNQTEPQSLRWAREIQALAQTGLTSTNDKYDREHYKRLRALAAEMIAQQIGSAAQSIEALFTEQTGYSTQRSMCAGRCSGRIRYCSFGRRAMAVDGHYPAGGPM
jgi:hypothetical protein